VPFSHWAKVSQIAASSASEQGWPSGVTVGQVPPVVPLMNWQLPTRHRAAALQG